MKTLLKLIEKQNLASALLAILAIVVFPTHNVQADSTETASFVFEVTEESLTKSLLTYQELMENDYLVKNLELYLLEKKSPLAPFAGEIVKLPQWEHAMGIVFVESNFCRFAKNYNCGSLGVAPGHRQWRKYANAYEGFKDLTTLLEKPMYKERLNTCGKKIGIYVVPGSARWKNGCEKVEKEMQSLVADANLVRQEVANQHLTNNTHPLLAMVK